MAMLDGGTNGDDGKTVADAEKDGTKAEEEEEVDENYNEEEEAEMGVSNVKKSNCIAPIDKTSVHKICSGQVGRSENRQICQGDFMHIIALASRYHCEILMSR